MKPTRLSLAIYVLLPLVASTAWAASLTHGPIVGGVTPTSAVVFLRTDVPASGFVRALCCSVPFDTPFTTTGDMDNTAQVAIGGLYPGISYTVQVYVNGVLQHQTSTFKAFPPANSPATFLFAHLTDFAGPTESPSPGDIFDRVAAENPAFVLIGGDFDHRNPGRNAPDEETALGNYRAMFQSLYDPESPGMLKLVTQILRRFPIAHVWDDHDYGDNNTNRFWKFRDQANKAFREYVPTYPLPAESLKGIWQRFTYGRLAEFFLLDLRSQRDRNGQFDDQNKSMLEGDPIGPGGQLDWLKAGLLAAQQAGVTWKFILSTVVWNPTARKGMDQGPYDNWFGFQNEQDALREWITANNIRNVVILSGDAHFGALDDGTNDGTEPSYPEMVTPAANFTTDTPYHCDNLDTRGTWNYGTYGPGLGPICNGYSTVLVNEQYLVLRVKDDTGAMKREMTIPRQE